MPKPPLSPDKRKTYRGQKISQFCLNVQKKRLELGLTQKLLAAKIGVAHPRISEIESGRFPEDPDRIIALARALEVDINWLFGFDPDNYGEEKSC